jgi:lipopolysaccharide export system permease protein
VPTFDRYLCTRLLAQFGFFALVLVAVYWVNRALSLFDDLIAGGSSLWTFLVFTALALPNVVHAVLPVAALVAALYGINRLAADSELVVAQTTGLGPWHLARPVGIFALAVAAMVSILGHALVPASRTALAERGEALRADVTAQFLKAGEFLSPGDDITVYVREITEEGELLGLFLMDRRDADALAGQGVRTTYTAERALLVRQDGGPPRLVMFAGIAQTLDVATGNLVVTRFEDFTYDLGALMGSEGMRRTDPREMPTADLLRADEALATRTGRPLGALVFEGHVRFAEALFALSLPLLALGCLLQGGYSRLGLWRQIAAAVVLAILLRVASNLTEGPVREDPGSWPMIYGPPFLTLVLGLILIARATRGRRPAGKEPSAGGAAGSPA